ncbi:MFS transporter [Candidatus Woesearchaeota archaeon]|nr:MFS transporter [Candidatus Woesearchaeota archaeon]
MVFFKKGELEHIGFFYAYLVITNLFAVIWPFWIIYLHGNGFSLSAIAIGLGLFSASGLLFEVPLGAISDVMGRKLSFLIGEILSVIVFIAMPFASTPSLLWALLFAWGLTVSLKSGIEEAWIVDYLKAKKHDELIKEFYIKRESLSNFSLAFASFLSALLVQYFSMDFLWFINAFAILVGIFFLLKQKEVFFRKKSAFSGYMIDSVGMVKESVAFSQKHKTLLLLLLGVGLLSLGVELAYIGWQPFLLQNGIPAHYIGYLAGIGWAVSGLMPFAARFLVRKVKYEHSYLSYLSWLTAALHLLLLVVLSPFYVSFVYVFRFLRFGLHEPILDPYFQMFVPSKIRSTLGSMKSMVIDISYIAADVLFALFAERLGLSRVMFISGLLILPAAYVFHKIRDLREDKLYRSSLTASQRGLDPKDY